MAKSKLLPDPAGRPGHFLDPETGDIINKGSQGLLPDGTVDPTEVERQQQADQIKQLQDAVAAQRDGLKTQMVVIDQQKAQIDLHEAEQKRLQEQVDLLRGLLARRRSQGALITKTLQELQSEAKQRGLAFDPEAKTEQLIAAILDHDGYPPAEKEIEVL